jgi:hypothetical protein
MYTDFAGAYFEDLASGKIEPYDGAAFVPTTGTFSGFLYNRFRDEFRPAMDAWLATDPGNNPDAPATPFVMPEYTVAEFEAADALAVTADQAAVDARAANQNGDNYVLTAVLFAAVLFFSGVASKLENRWNRLTVNLIGIIGVVIGAAILISLPILV